MYTVDKAISGKQVSICTVPNRGGSRRRIVEVHLFFIWRNLIQGELVAVLYTKTLESDGDLMI